MKKIMNKKLSLFGKQIPIIIVLALLLVGAGSAALLSYFGRITTTANVEQSILLDDGQEVSHTIPETSPGGEIFCYKHKLTNRMSVPGTVTFETEITDEASTCNGMGENMCNSNSLCKWQEGQCALDTEGVDVTYFDLREKLTDGDNDVSGCSYINQRGQMVFEGSLTQDGEGYTGTIPSICAFDLYAKEGGCAYVEGYYGTGDFNCNGEDTFTIGHSGSELKDAYPSSQEGGPWGSFWDPDVEDAGYNPTHYYLNLNADGTWTIEYKETEQYPLQGELNWDTMLALENQMDWKQQWTWGFDYIPLGHPAWDISVTDLTGGNYRIVMTPVGTPTDGMQLMSGEADDFAVCYEFDKAIAPADYVMTTTIV